MYVIFSILSLSVQLFLVHIHIFTHCVIHVQGKYNGMEGTVCSVSSLRVRLILVGRAQLHILLIIGCFHWTIVMFLLLYHDYSAGRHILRILKVEGTPDNSPPRMSLPTQTYT